MTTIIDPHTGQPVQWNGLVDYNQVRGYEQLLQGAGLWNDSWVNSQDWMNMDRASQVAANDQFESSSLAALGGYQVGSSRNGYTVTDYLLDPQGNVVGQRDRYDQGDSFHSDDYAKMAAVIAAGLGTAYTMGDLALVGSAAAGGGTAGAAGATSAGAGGATAGTAAAGGGSVAGSGFTATGTGLGGTGAGLSVGSGATLGGSAAAGGGTAAGTGAAAAGGGSSLTSALVRGGAGLLSTYMQGNAAQDAAAAQQAAAQAGQTQAQQMYAQLMQSLQPYLSAGTSALTAQGNLQGLNGNPAQQTAINELQASPQFQSALKLGENRILANASATGGLRGGNTQAALAQFSPQLLSATINDQLTRLSGVTGQGLSATGMGGTAGQNTSSLVAQLLQTGGAAAAGGALAQGQTNAGYVNALMGAIGYYTGGGF